jgi:leucine-rich repeat protein SHOC2
MINMPQKGLTEFPPIQPAETQIRLDSNQISSIPSTLGQFRQLQILRLRNNKIESLPGEIGNLNALTQLLLSNNLITKLPNEIGGLVSLTDLRIENNQLTELPKEIGNLPNLTHLFLDNNKLSYFPPEIKNLTKLVHLSVTGNNLPLPPDYNPLNPLQTINFVLNNQTYKGNVESLITKKAFYFVNAKKDSVVGKYISLVKEFSKNNNVEFIEVKSESDITLETNVVFFNMPN